MDITKLEKEIERCLGELSTSSCCATFHAKYLGKNGEITGLMQNLRNVEPSERSRVGALLNNLKRCTEQTLNTKQNQIKKQEVNEKLLADELIDITIPKIGKTRGGLHPVTVVMREVEQVFQSMGFHIEDGPEIVTEYQNFTSLNIPQNHPARDIQDTFWLDNLAGESATQKKETGGIGVQGSDLVLKTHTSAMQNTLLKKHGPEFRAIFPGRCYRNESVDASHDMAFFQVEGMMVGRQISIANLIYFMKQALSAVFKKEVQIRLRPGYFPFTEPSFELDASCTFCSAGCIVCKQSGWIEFCGCGMIHPNVLKEGGVDPNKYQGFAFGFGLTRLVMLKHGIKDIRELHN